MKKMIEVGMVLVALFALLTASAFAAEPLAYGSKDSMQIGPVFQHTVLDTYQGQLEGDEYGIKGSFAKPAAGYFGHVIISKVKLKGAYDDFDNSIEGGSSAITLELSKSFEKFGNGFQLGVYAKGKRYFGSIKGSESGVNEYYGDYFGQMVSEPWSDQTKIKNLQTMEGGVLLQKDFEQLHLFAGPMLQVIKADWVYVYQSQYGAWEDKTKVVSKSGLGSVAGALINLNKDLSIKVSVTFKEHATYDAGLNYTCF